MKLKIWTLAAAVAALGFAWPQQTPKTMATAYGSLADSILAVKKTETDFVRCILADHYRAAREASQKGDSERAAAEMALFGNEGDNAIGGVRKRLLEGGHHHNAEGEAKGIYDPGFVIVTKKVKEQALADSAAMRTAKTDADRKAVWDKFAAMAAPLAGE